MPIATGAVVGLVGLVLVGVVVGITDASDDDSRLALAIPLLAIALLSLTAGGRIAASRSHRMPLVHAAVAATAAVALADLFVIVRQLVTDDPIAWAEAAAWLLLGLAAGLLGGRRALRPRRRADSPG
ncbi:MAG: hypothetical protein ACRD2C_14335 [Acidimicrobiales bacterium]